MTEGVSCDRPHGPARGPHRICGHRYPRCVALALSPALGFRGLLPNCRETDASRSPDVGASYRPACWIMGSLEMTLTSRVRDHAVATRRCVLLRQAIYSISPVRAVRRLLPQRSTDCTRGRRGVASTPTSHASPASRWRSRAARPCAACGVRRTFARLRDGLSKANLPHVVSPVFDKVNGATLADAAPRITCSGVLRDDPGGVRPGDRRRQARCRRLSTRVPLFRRGSRSIHPSRTAYV